MRVILFLTLKVQSILNFFFKIKTQTEISKVKEGEFYVISMKTPLVPDTSDHKWILLRGIIELLQARRSRQEIAKFGIKPANRAYTNIVIVLLSMFFSEEISYIIQEIEKRIEQQQFLNINQIPNPDNVHRFISQFSEEQFFDGIWYIKYSLS